MVPAVLDAGVGLTMALFVPPKPQIVNPAGTHDCYFQYEAGGTLCRLIPFGGNQIMTGGVRQTIPAAGVTLAPNAAWASYPVLFAGVGISGGVMILAAFDPVANPVVIDAYGMPVFTGQTNFTLVGAFTRNGSTTAFAQSAQFGGVISYWNRRQRTVRGTWSVASASGGWIELSSAARLTMVGFVGDAIRFTYSGTVYSDTSGAGEGTQVYYSFNGGAANYIQPPEYFIQSQAYATAPFGFQFDLGPISPAALMTSFLFGYIASGGTGTWYGDCSAVFEG